MNASAIGVIGGADGPTAVFVTTQLSSRAAIVIPAVILTLLIVAGVILYLHSHKKG